MVACNLHFQTILERLLRYAKMIANSMVSAVDGIPFLASWMGCSVCLNGCVESFVGQLTTKKSCQAGILWKYAEIVDHIGLIYPCRKTLPQVCCLVVFLQNEFPAVGIVERTRLGQDFENEAFSDADDIVAILTSLRFSKDQ
jgi:hypothetical protein